MGFRSNFITESYIGIEIPQWFLDKYPNYSYSKNSEGKETFSIAQLWESKYYQVLEEDERILDIQKILKEVDFHAIVLILLHECGGITRVEIEQDKITSSEPTEWKQVTSVEHDYCYNCSTTN